jgi:hypothetical protein
MIVLLEDVSNPRVLESRRTVGLGEKNPLVTVLNRGDANNVWDRQRLEMKGHGTVCWMRASY